jgi:hypothetical protein
VEKRLIELARAWQRRLLSAAEWVELCGLLRKKPNHGSDSAKGPA